VPKLSQAAIEEKKVVIEEAAKTLFIKQGFHATSMRDIARGASVSLGNLYNYYRTKEEILESIIEKYLVVIDDKLRDIFDQIDEPLETENLLRLSGLIKKIVNENHDFWLLMYIDVLEFQNRHFRKMFEGLADKFRRRFEAEFAQAQRERKIHPKVDPAVAFTTAYMQFFNYFLVEKLFGGNSHFGLDDDKVMRSLTDIICRGIAHPKNQ
jgi:AcrR family transcriptional regulator